jgi:hypothetical protein
MPGAHIINIDLKIVMSKPLFNVTYYIMAVIYSEAMKETQIGCLLYEASSDSLF